MLWRARLTLSKLKKANQMCGSFLFLNFYLGGYLACIILRVHLWKNQRIPGPVSCRCPGGSLETPLRWHATIYCLKPVHRKNKCFKVNTKMHVMFLFCLWNPHFLCFSNPFCSVFNYFQCFLHKSVFEDHFRKHIKSKKVFIICGRNAFLCVFIQPLTFFCVGYSTIEHRAP